MSIVDSNWVELAREQLPTPWIQYAISTKKGFKDFCGDKDACAFENGEQADLADVQSRWRTIEFWRAKIFGYKQNAGCLCLFDASKEREVS